MIEKVRQAQKITTTTTKKTMWKRRWQKTKLAAPLCACIICYLINSFYVLKISQRLLHTKTNIDIQYLFIYLRKNLFASYRVSNLGRVLCQPCETTLCATCSFFIIIIFLFLFTCEWNLIFDAWCVYVCVCICLCSYEFLWWSQWGNTIKSNLWINRTWFENGKINL